MALPQRRPPHVLVGRFCYEVLPTGQSSRVLGFDSLLRNLGTHFLVVSCALAARLHGTQQAGLRSASLLRRVPSDRLVLALPTVRDYGSGNLRASLLPSTLFCHSLCRVLHGLDDGASQRQDQMGNLWSPLHDRDRTVRPIQSARIWHAGKQPTIFLSKVV